jgi:hypothetical protein
MRTVLRRPILTLLLVPILGAWLVLATTAHAAVSTTPIDVTFEHDSVGAKTFPWASVDSPSVTFDIVEYQNPALCKGAPCPVDPNDIFNWQLFVGNPSANANRIIVADETVGDGALRMTFARPTQTIRVTYYFSWPSGIDPQATQPY